MSAKILFILHFLTRSEEAWVRGGCIRTLHFKGNEKNQLQTYLQRTLMPKGMVFLQLQRSAAVGG